MRRRRTFVNLVAVLLASGVLVVYALTQLVASAVLEDTYDLFVELPEAGGLVENKQVTYRGVAVGEIVDTELAGGAVRVHLGIHADVAIPREVDVVVLRQSAVGEQALDLRPRARTTDDTPVHEPGDTIVPQSILLPTRTQDLLQLASDVFGPVDPDHAAIVVSELADAVRGRRDDVRDLLADSATFSEAVADNGADYDRLFAASRTVNASLAANREVLASLVTELADSVELVGELRDEIEGLLETAPPTLAVTSDFLERSQANLWCAVEDLAAINDYLARPEVLHTASEALRVNRYFFGGFEQIGQADASGQIWLRLQLALHPQPAAQSHLPDRRPIPDVLPGGACTSPFGPGAGSAVQADHQLAVPEARIVRPADDRQQPVRRPGGGTLPASSAAPDPAAAAAAAPAPDPVATAGPSPDPWAPAVAAASTTSPSPTGGGWIALVGGVTLLLAAGLLRRVRRPGTDHPTGDRDG